MGYRSNGGMVIFGPEDTMTAHLFRLKATKTHDYAWQCPEVRTIKKDGRLIWMLEFHDWKWYPDYSDVTEFERIWDESAAVSEETGIQGYRWRFGEEDEDTFQSSFGEDANEWDNFHIVFERSVDHMFQGV